MKSKLSLITLVLAMVAGSAVFAAAQDYRYGGSDDHRYYDRDGDRDDNFRRGLEVARNSGFRDGAEVARQDMWRNKPFNPNPRGHNHADQGYRDEFGSLREYREHYSAAYRDGYASAFRQNGYYR